MTKRSTQNTSAIITSDAYPEKDGVTLEYHSTNTNATCCILCRHWTARRDLRKSNRWIVILSEDVCRLGERCCISERGKRLLAVDHIHTGHCPKFEKIPEPNPYWTLSEIREDS